MTPNPPASSAPAAPAVRLGRGRLVFGVLLSLVAGSMVSLQSRVNSDLGAVMGDPLGAAIVSFGTGLIVLWLATALLPAGRRGLARIPQLVRTGAFPWWYLLAGLGGATSVSAQTLTTPVLGVSVFILSLVVGQSLGGLLVDRAGLGPAGRRPLTLYRLVGTAIILGSVFTAMTPRLGGGTATGSLPTLLTIALLPITAGVMSTVQTAWNGGITALIGTPLTATTINFTAGTLGLLVATAVLRAVRGGGSWNLPGDWWLYTGGLAGIFFVAAAAVLARWLGILQTSLGMITGTLLSALLLDAVVPTPSSVVTPVTVVGTLCTLIGLVVATLPWRRGLQTLRDGATGKGRLRRR